MYVNINYKFYKSIKYKKKLILILLHNLIYRLLLMFDYIAKTEIKSINKKRKKK